MGVLVNIDDICHIDRIKELALPWPERICFRYNPGSKRTGNAIIGNPVEAKYGVRDDQIVSCYKRAKEEGSSFFALHTMVASNELDESYIVETARMLFSLVKRIKEEAGVDISLLDLGGGVGIPYRLEDDPISFYSLASKIKALYDDMIIGEGLNPVRISFEMGRAITGPFGYLISKVRHVSHKYKDYVGLDACMANLMRPALYGAYHHITVLGKEADEKDHVYDVTGSLCENNDKFAIDRRLPKIERGDVVVIHDAGAHGHSMGFNYNGKLRCSEYLKENVWRHHSISFDASTGKLVKYIDGLEEEVVYLTSTGDKTGSPYYVDFSHMALDPLYLGQGFIGGVDSFYFTPSYKQSFNLYKYLENGEIISKVIDFGSTNTFIDSVNYMGSFTNGSYIDIYYRTSDYYFAPDDNNINWQLLDDNNVFANVNRARYIQIRAVLKSNIDRNITPVLNNIDIVYHSGRLPLVPDNLTAEPLNNNSIMLRWRGSHENVSGYKIYYGTKSGVYNNAEHTPIVVGNQTEYLLEGLNSQEVYYFRVTAIGGEGGNIESGFSEEVYARPVQ